MIRFIVNFFLFGILFFLIWHFFPEAFGKLVSWASNVYDFLQSLVMSLVGKIQQAKPSEEPAKQSFILFQHLFWS